MQISSATVSSIICKQDFNILKFNTILTQVSSALFHTLHISTCHLQRFSPYLSFLLPPYFYAFSSGENWHIFPFLLILLQQVNEIALHTIPNKNVKSSKPSKGDTSVPDHRTNCCIIKENVSEHQRIFIHGKN